MNTPYYFCLPQLQSPTFDNVSRVLHEHGWQQTDELTLANFSWENFQFNPEAAECLEFKNLLAHLVAPCNPLIMPLTYCINDYNWQSILNQIENSIWILKPATLNNGQNIKIIENLNQLEQHFLSSNRVGGEHVLQQYIKPHLLKGPELGHKYSIRMFVVISNYAGAYLFPRGYFNIAINPYQENNFTDLRCHLTNEHLNHHEQNVVQIPTDHYELFKPFYPQIKSILTSTMKELKYQIPDAFICETKKTLAIFGFDFMVDSNERVWLIEANHGPCFPTTDEHPLQKKLYYEFWQAFYRSFVLPIASMQPLDSIDYSAFHEL